MSVSLQIRSAAVLLWITAVGLGLPCLLAIRNLLTGRGIPFVLGFPAYGGGPFERRGIHTTIPLLIGFLTLSILEGVAAWLLRDANKAGGILALALIPVGAIYWWGFALPFPPLFAVARTALIVLDWKSLR